ncbi:MAG: phospholipase [Thermoanaerobaculia bacterium]
MGEQDMTADVEVRQIAASVHGRYLVDATAGEGAPLLLGCHGYGENADRHLEKLQRIPGAERWLLCAVQGLHRFYNTRTGDVLASWMTSQDRELAIADNVRYVAAVVAEVRQRYRTAERTVVAGFSQGVAMAYRAAAGAVGRCHGLVALAGDVPPDVASSPPKEFPPVLLGRGTEDEWYTEGKMEADLAVLADLGADVTACVFDGGHDWTPEFYAAAGEFLARVGGPS